MNVTPIQFHGSEWWQDDWFVLLGCMHTFVVNIIIKMVAEKGFLKILFGSNKRTDGIESFFIGFHVFVTSLEYVGLKFWVMWNGKHNN